MISTANTSHTLINTHDVNRLDTSCQSHVDVMNKDISLLWKNELTSRVRIFCQTGIEKQPCDRKNDYYKGKDCTHSENAGLSVKCFNSRKMLLIMSRGFME